MIDPNTPRGGRALARLTDDKIIWLTTVRPNGQPQTSPVWFLFVNGEFLVYSLPGTARTSNIEANPPGISQPGRQRRGRRHRLDRRNRPDRPGCRSVECDRGLSGQVRRVHRPQRMDGRVVCPRLPARSPDHTGAQPSVVIVEQWGSPSS